jgi:hypothetical protein
MGTLGAWMLRRRTAERDGNGLCATFWGSGVRARPPAVDGNNASLGQVGASQLRNARWGYRAAITAR